MLKQKRPLYYAASFALLKSGVVNESPLVIIHYLGFIGILNNLSDYQFHCILYTVGDGLLASAPPYNSRVCFAKRVWPNGNFWRLMTLEWAGFGGRTRHSYTTRRVDVARASGAIDQLRGNIFDDGTAANFGIRHFRTRHGNCRADKRSEFLLQIQEKWRSNLCPIGAP